MRDLPALGSNAASGAVMEGGGPPDGSGMADEGGAEEEAKEPPPPPSEPAASTNDAPAHLVGASSELTVTGEPRDGAVVLHLTAADELFVIDFHGEGKSSSSMPILHIHVRGSQSQVLRSRTSRGSRSSTC